jgi:hypoxanthine phosphoribosyltransferase
MTTEASIDCVPVTKLSWIDFERHSVAVSNKLLKAQVCVDAIVAIQRGGCVPGVLLAHLLGVSSFFTLGVRTTAGEGIRATRMTPVVTGSDALYSLKDRAVLIVDDVCNTGTTLRLAKSCVESFEPSRIVTAVTIWDGEGGHPCAADFYGHSTPGWVIFPWEQYDS